MAKGPAASNQILARLPAAERERLLAAGTRLDLPNRRVLADPGKPIHHVYFPLSSVLSALIVLSDGSAVEGATIGCEGMTGLGLLINEEASPYRVLQEVPGSTWRVPAQTVRELLKVPSQLRELLIRYTLVLLRQSAQNAACNLRHSIDQRMCRWLLTTYDRTRRDEFDITQEFLGEMLGVRRQTINQTARRLQADGLVEYRRGRLKLVDQEGLHIRACECYDANRTMYKHLMDQV